jgi:hypothetical protein
MAWKIHRLGTLNFSISLTPFTKINGAVTSKINKYFTDKSHEINHISIHSNTFLETHCETQDKYKENLITYKSLDKRLTSVLHTNDVEKDKRQVRPLITLPLHLHSSS